MMADDLAHARQFVDELISREKGEEAMLTEIEQGVLSDLIDSYGLKGVVDALASECARRGSHAPDYDRAWLDEATHLMNAVAWLSK
jgi:hypothetical protein